MANTNLNQVMDDAANCKRPCRRDLRKNELPEDETQQLKICLKSFQGAEDRLAAGKASAEIEATKQELEAVAVEFSKLAMKLTDHAEKVDAVLAESEDCVEVPIGLERLLELRKRLQQLEEEKASVQALKVHEEQTIAAWSNETKEAAEKAQQAGHRAKHLTLLAADKAAQAKHEEEEQARREAEEKARKEAEEKARREAEEKAQQESEEKARGEAEEKMQPEAQERPLPEAQETAQGESNGETAGLTEQKRAELSESKACAEDEKSSSNSGHHEKDKMAGGPVASHLAADVPDLLQRLLVKSEACPKVSGEYRRMESSWQGHPAFKKPNEQTYLIWSPREGGHWIFTRDPASEEILARNLQVSVTATPEEISHRSWTMAPWRTRGSKIMVDILGL
ncbi:unnamed protein product [Durusdinium trenchii]|uniref:Uncharacterized protein n=1 Tax=Durusdinium trenchii TaxID=1381693 RepID=A0ABP0RX36_9DINO